MKNVQFTQRACKQDDRERFLLVWRWITFMGRQLVEVPGKEFKLSFYFKFKTFRINWSIKFFIW